MRQKSFLRYFFRLWGWQALILGLLAGGSLMIASTNGQNSQRLQREGVETTAELTRVYRSEDRDTDGTRSYSYHVAFRFTVDGKLYEDNQTVSNAFYQTVGTGQRVPVRYLANDPSISEIEPGATATWAFYARLAAIGLGFAALMAARAGWNRARLAAWLFRHGVEDSAVVTDHVESWLRINDGSRWRARFRTANGREGETYLARQRNLPPVGMTIYVLSDPDGRRDSVWSGDL